MWGRAAVCLVLVAWVVCACACAWVCVRARALVWCVGGGWGVVVGCWLVGGVVGCGRGEGCVWSRGLGGGGSA